MTKNSLRGFTLFELLIVIAVIAILATIAFPAISCGSYGYPAEEACRIALKYRTPVIILTAHGTIPDAVAAVKKGIFGYLTKPYDAEELLHHIQRALTLHGGSASMQAGVGQLWREDIVTRSSLMEDLLAKAQRVAALQLQALEFLVQFAEVLKLSEGADEVAQRRPKCEFERRPQQQRGFGGFGAK